MCTQSVICGKIWNLEADRAVVRVPSDPCVRKVCVCWEIRVCCFISSGDPSLSNLSRPFSHKSLRHRRNPNLVSLPSHRSHTATAFPSRLATYHPSLRSMCHHDCPILSMIYSLCPDLLHGPWIPKRQKGKHLVPVPHHLTPFLSGAELPCNRWMQMTPMVVTWHREVRIKFKFGPNPKIKLTPSKPVWTTYFLHGLDTGRKIGPSSSLPQSDGSIAPNLRSHLLVHTVKSYLSSAGALECVSPVGETWVAAHYCVTGLFPGFS
jgi:hypothetical protein